MEHRRSILATARSAALSAGLALALFWPAAALAGPGANLWNPAGSCDAASGGAASDTGCASSQAPLTDQPFIGEGNIFAFGGGGNRMLFGGHANDNSVLERAIVLGFYRAPPGLGRAGPPRRSVEDYPGTDFLTFDLAIPGGGTAAISLSGFASLESIVAPAIFGSDAPTTPVRAADTGWPSGACAPAAGSPRC